MESRDEIHEDVENTIGLVPTFMEHVPDEALGGFWDSMKNFELADTAIPQKYKQLIGLAVAAQIPCAYCVTFHKEGARMNGATRDELDEAVMMGALTRQGSSIVNATGQDLAAFQDEVKRMRAFVSAHSRGAEPGTQQPPLAP